MAIRSLQNPAAADGSCPSRGIQGRSPRPDPHSSLPVAQRSPVRGQGLEPPLCNRGFAHPAQQIAFQTYLNALEYEERRKLELEAQIKEAIELSPWSRLVRALQALKGVGPIVAATIVTEVGDFARFTHPRQLVAYFGLAPGEHSSGSSIRPRGITKAGNTTARSILCEAAWNYRTTPKVGQWMKQHRPEVPQEIIEIAWKAQLRLHKTYRRLTSRGKRTVVATAAVARELLCFMWSIGRALPANG